eukprot:scaffold4716_cov109-Isochrysis_galbana.AAC.2
MSGSVSTPSSLEVEEKIGDCCAHVRVADLAERGALLLDGDEIIGVGDEVWVVPFFHCLLLNGRRSVGQSVRSVCCLSLALPRRVMCGQWCGSFRA